MASQAAIPHAGQLRYHDFSKLREIHYARLSERQRWRTTSAPTLFLSSSALPFSLSSLSHSPTTQLSQIRTFITNPFTQTLRDLSLKRLERTANAEPENAAAQYQFLSELSKQHPDVVIQRLRLPQFRPYAVNMPVAILYLQILQQQGQQNQFDVADLLQRLSRSGALSPSQVNQAKVDLGEMKLSKQDQVQHVLYWLTSGATAAIGATGIAGAAGMPLGAAAAAPAASAGLPGYSAGMGRGADAKNPLYVQMAASNTTARQAVFSFLTRAALLFVAFSAVGALLDERGLGRGMGMNPGSKHIQEAEQDADGKKVTFDDVKGVQEAKAELEEIVMYLKDPSRFTRLGGKLPRGLLLTGPPGTGKTLLAKAIAGEADVPFFYSSGSQFEEVYVGLGAKRVRELFEAAKKKSPSIIFIDEIDAVGGTRKLKDQSALKMTLNELLVQLDGFDENNGIIVIGATNFMESLDSALLRPGRFDKHVSVPLPDVGGRKEILEMYSKKTKLNKDVDLNLIARGTTGFSGADLYNLINQAALKASIDGLNAINMHVLEYAKDKILMGAERKSAVITKETAKCTAYHEAGHAVVAVLTPGANKVHKATIMPRGNALGMVMTLPEGDQTSNSRKQLLAMMDVTMGGRVAEELIFGKEEATSGAAADIQSATNIARTMVTKYGFSDKVGLVFYGDSRGDESASGQTRSLIDSEVKGLTNAAYTRARDLLTKHSTEHKLLAETLLEYETLTGPEVEDLVLRKKKPSRPVINKDDGQRGDQSVLTDSSNSSKKESKSRARTKRRLPGSFGRDYP